LLPAAPDERLGGVEPLLERGGRAHALRWEPSLSDLSPPRLFSDTQLLPDYRPPRPWDVISRCRSRRLFSHPFLFLYKNPLPMPRLPTLGLYGTTRFTSLKVFPHEGVTCVLGAFSFTPFLLTLLVPKFFFKFFFLIDSFLCLDFCSSPIKGVVSCFLGGGGGGCFIWCNGLFPSDLAYLFPKDQVLPGNALGGRRSLPSQAPCEYSYP